MSSVVPFPTPTVRVADSVLINAARDRLAIRVANELLAEGYHVTSIQTDTRYKPVIWVDVDVRLAALVAHDHACYYKHGFDFGPYRVGQYHRDGAVVQWVERPGNTAWWRN